MAELLRIQTGSGVLIVTETSVTLERPSLAFGGRKPQTIMRSAITSVDSKVTIPAVLGRGGAMRIVLHGQGSDVMEINGVPLKAAEQLLSLLR